jgi:hypothetical protein
VKNPFKRKIELEEALLTHEGLRIKLEETKQPE